jgi:hypothetical protein
MLADGDYTNRRSIEAIAELGVDYVGSLRKGGAEKDNTGTGRFTAAVFVYDPEHDYYVCPGDKHLRYEGRHSDGTNTSRETFSIATKLALRTVKTVRSSRNAVPAISIAAAACCAPKKPRP